MPALLWAAPASAWAAVGQSSSLLSLFWTFFSGRCLEASQQVSSTTMEISNNGIIKTSRGPSPTPLCYEKQHLAARQGTEQPRFQNETCREFPSERLPSRWLIRPRGPQFGIQAASQEGISSCSGPGARVLPEPRTSSCCQSLGSVGRVGRTLHIPDAQ